MEEQIHVLTRASRDTYMLWLLASFFVFSIAPFGRNSLYFWSNTFVYMLNFDEQVEIFINYVICTLVWSLSEDIHFRQPFEFLLYYINYSSFDFSLFLWMKALINFFPYLIYFNHPILAYNVSKSMEFPVCENFTPSVPHCYLHSVRWSGGMEA